MSKEFAVRMFPFTLILIDICAALVYLYFRDLRRGIYWLAAATLTACVSI